MTDRNTLQRDASGASLPPTSRVRRSGYFEIWTCSPEGKLMKHGMAPGVTFSDACKHLACTSLDFWTHYERDHYRGLPLYPSREAALRAYLGRLGTGPVE